MELLRDIIEKTNEACDLIEMGCNQEAMYAINEIETLVIQLPAGVEDWAHALHEEFRLFAEARQWMVRDPFHALEKMREVVAAFEAVNAECLASETPPELPEDLAAVDGFEFAA